MVLGSGRSGWRSAAMVAAACLVLGTEARAQSSIGFTGGGSIDPEQVYAGVFWQSPDIGGRFRVRPGIDGGWGDGLRLGIVNIDFVYLLPIGQSQWNFVTGGGPAVVMIRYAGDFAEAGTEVTAGGSWVFGFAHDNGFFADFRTGGGNVPALKFGVGYAVKLR